MNAVDNNDEPPLMYRTHDAQSKRKHPSRNYNQHLWINSPSKEPHIDYFFKKKLEISKKSKKSVKYAASFVGARVDAAVQGVSQERFEPEFPV